MPLGNPGGYGLMKQRIPNQGRPGVPRAAGGMKAMGGPRQKSPGIGQGFQPQGFGDGTGMTKPGMPIGGSKGFDAFGQPQIIDPGMEGSSMMPGIPPPASLGPQTMGPVNATGVAGGGGMFNSQALFDQLNKITGGEGLFNTESFKRRTGDARSKLERVRAGESDTLQAQLAERGLLRSGAESEALSRHSADMEGQQTEAFNSILGDETNRAEDRLMQALGIGSQIYGGDAERGVTERLGMANVGLGHERNSLDYLLGTGRLDLDRNRLNSEIDQSGMDRIIAILQQLGQGADRSRGGFWGRNR